MPLTWPAVRERRRCCAERLRLNGDVVTLDDLHAARSERDEEWTQVLRRFDGETSAGSVARFEAGLRRADDVADQLRTEADAVARRAEIEVRRRRLHRDSEALDERERALDDARADDEQRWQRAWQPSAVTPSSPVVMTQWLRGRETVLERHRVVQRLRSTLISQRTAQEAHVAALRTELTAMAHTVVGDMVSTLIAQSQQISAAARRAHEGSSDLESTVKRARAAAGRQTGVVAEKQREIDAWAVAWERLIAAAGWPADVTARSARQVLGRIDELFTQLHEVERLTARVTGIQGRLDGFAGDALELAAAVAPELASWPAPDAITELATRRSAAVDARGRRETFAGQLDEACAEVETAEKAVREARRDLDALVEFSGVADVADLPETERDSQRAAELRELIPQLEGEICDAGRAPVEELAAQIADADIDALRAQSEQVAQKLSGLEMQLGELDGRAGELRREREQMEAGGGAAGAAEDLEQQASQLRDLSERYLLAYLTAWALTRAIDRYRREHKAPLLRRADELFPALTCGQFRTLEVSFDDKDQPILIGVRVNGERVEVRQMSTGTREQLYLSLRLASLERHVDLHGQMPIVLDDVVLHSDPGRKRAILAAVGELARKTQIITFTHDPQVVALARDVVPEEVLTVHELGGRQISGARRPQIAPGDVRPLRPAQAA
jgi:uncharacterized protein YhaN